MGIGYNVGMAWVDLAQRVEQRKYEEINEPHEQIKLITDHLDGLSCMLRCIQQETRKDHKKNEKVLDLYTNEDHKNLVDRVRTNANQGLEAGGVPLIPECCYKWTGDQIEQLVTTLNRESERLSSSIPQHTSKITQLMEEIAHFVKASSEGRKRNQDEIDHTLRQR